MLYLLTKSGGEYEDQWTTNVKLFKSRAMAEAVETANNSFRQYGQKQLKLWNEKRDNEVGKYPYGRSHAFVMEHIRKCGEFAKENPRPEYEDVYWEVEELEEPDE